MHARAGRKPSVRAAAGQVESIKSEWGTLFLRGRIGTADLSLEALHHDAVEFRSALRIQRGLACGGEQHRRIDPARGEQGIERMGQRGAVFAIQFPEKKNIAVYLLKFPVRQCPRAIAVTAGPRDQENNDTEGTHAPPEG